MSTTAVCFRCCFFFFEICSKVSQNGRITQLQLSATQPQLSRNSAQLSCNSAELQTILFKRLSCTFWGLSCTPQLTATQSFPTFKKHYKTRATQRNSLQLTGPRNLVSKAGGTKSAFLLKGGCFSAATGLCIFPSWSCTSLPLLATTATSNAFRHADLHRFAPDLQAANHCKSEPCDIEKTL